MLFSEPKIPQFDSLRYVPAVNRPFSALQRAENSSILRRMKDPSAARHFQCSSASRKFLNSTSTAVAATCAASFSALQRAENSSILPSARAEYLRRAFSALQRAENSSIDVWQRGGLFAPLPFQCSSASRKFLNAAEIKPRGEPHRAFSALQRAENSSIEDPALLALFRSGFQCSSASRKFLNVVEYGCGDHLP